MYDQIFDSHVVSETTTQLIPNDSKQIHRGAVDRIHKIIDDMENIEEKIDDEENLYSC